MKRVSRLWTIVALLASPGAGWATDGPEPLRVTSKVVVPGPYFVGQGIEVRVEVADSPGSLTFEPPKLAADVHALAIDPAKPSIGRFVVIPRRAGSLDLGALRVRSGERSGSSRPSRLNVASVPVEDRSPAFLGGVGSFEVKGEVEPATIRLGQELEFRLKLTGPAAWGSDRSPDLSSWETLGGGVRVEPLANSLEGVDPSSRTFRYRLRPKRAGQFVLPPVAVSAFDPRSKRFSTRATSGLPIVIAEPPRLDPSSIDYRPIVAPENFRQGPIVIGLGLAIVGLAALGFWFLAWRRRPKSLDPARLAAKLGRRLSERSGEDEAKAVVEALTEFLEAVGDRKPGVLTPPEAGVAFGRLTADSGLAKQAERLMIACDRACYDARASEASGLREEGEALFERVARKLERRRRKAEGPREAAETA